MKIHYEIIAEAELKSVAGGYEPVCIDIPGNSERGMKMRATNAEKKPPSSIYNNAVCDNYGLS